MSAKNGPPDVEIWEHYLGPIFGPYLMEVDGVDGSMECIAVECNGMESMECNAVEWNGMDAFLTFYVF